MFQTALEQAHERFESALRARDAVHASGSFKQFREAWTEFLMAVSAVYSKLEQGAKSNGKSNAWFGRKKHERRTDPLLSYLHHARDVDHHGIQRVTELHPGGDDIVGRGTALINGSMTIGTDGRTEIHPGFQITPISGEPLRIVEVPPHAMLVTVRDSRFDDSFDPPASHLGVRLDNAHPTTVADLCVAYLAAMLSEADKLPE